MNLKYSPCKSNHDTQIKVLDQNIIEIDGEWYGFDLESVIWPDIAEQTDGKIQEAHREDGELYITVLRFYTVSCASWDTANYHDIKPEGERP